MMSWSDLLDGLLEIDEAYERMFVLYGENQYFIFRPKTDNIRKRSHGTITVHNNNRIFHVTLRYIPKEMRVVFELTEMPQDKMFPENMLAKQHGHFDSAEAVYRKLIELEPGVRTSKIRQSLLN